MQMKKARAAMGTRLFTLTRPRVVKKLKRAEIAYLAAFHRLTSNGLLQLKNNVYNLAFTGV